jgi:hypothetical protein
LTTSHFFKKYPFFYDTVSIDISREKWHVEAKRDEEEEEYEV